MSAINDAVQNDTGWQALLAREGAQAHQGRPPLTMLEKAAAAAMAACPIARMHPEVGEHIARAVLLAIREPDAAMVGEAGALALNPYVGTDPSDTYYGTAQWADDCWRAMVDHILTESTGGRDGE